MPESLTEHLVSFAAGLEGRAASGPVLASAKKLLLDTMACALAGCEAPGIAALLAYARERGGTPEATVLVFGDRLPMPAAGLVNGAMIHAWDYDDVHTPGAPMHLTSVIVPAVLAAGEAGGATGRDALVAMALGFEVAGRLAMACGRATVMGFLPTTMLGGFGAAFAAGRLLGLSDAQNVQAMGIQYAQAAGNRQALLDRTLTKRLQPAFTARSAVESALLARRGITGPHRCLEGKAGLFRLHLNRDAPAAEELLAETPQLHIQQTSLKRYPSCGACHHVQMAAERLVAKHDLRAEQIDRIELFGCNPAGLVSGPFEPGPNPSVNAQFSAEWAVARTLLRGPATLPDYTDEAVAADEAVARLANEVRHAAAPTDIDLPEPKAQGVILHTRDGRRLVEAQARAWTFPPGGMGEEDLAKKFIECAAFGGVEDPEATRRIMDLVSALETAEDLSPLMRALTPHRGRKP